MTQSRRKALGIVLTLVSLLLWTGLCLAVYDALPASTPALALLVYFILAGLGWILPAMAIIRWMLRPDS